MRIGQHVKEHLTAKDLNMQGRSINIHLDTRVRIQGDDRTVVQPDGSLLTDPRADILDGCGIPDQLKTRQRYNRARDRKGWWKSLHQTSPMMPFFHENRE
jgi:hypothetical protein